MVTSWRSQQEEQSGQSGGGGGEGSVTQTLAGFSVSAWQHDTEWARVATRLETESSRV